MSTFLKRSTWTWPRPEHWTIHAGRCPHNFGHRYIAFGSRLEEIRWGRIRDKVGEGGWSSSGFVGSFPGGKTQFNLSISVVFLWRFSVEKKPKTPRNGALGNRWDWDSFHMVTMGFWHRPSPDITRYHHIYLFYLHFCWFFHHFTRYYPHPSYEPSISVAFFGGLRISEVSTEVTGPAKRYPAVVQVLNGWLHGILPELWRSHGKIWDICGKTMEIFGKIMEFLEISMV